MKFLQESLNTEKIHVRQQSVNLVRNAVHQQKYLKALAEIYPTPGYCGEIIRIFYAAKLSYGEQHLDEDEYLDLIKNAL